MITLFTNNTEECNILEKKLLEKGITYVRNENIVLMKERGFLALPKLEVSGNVYGFNEAMRWADRV